MTHIFKLLGTCGMLPRLMCSLGSGLCQGLGQLADLQCLLLGALLPPCESLLGMSQLLQASVSTGAHSWACLCCPMAAARSDTATSHQCGSPLPAPLRAWGLFLSKNVALCHALALLTGR